MIHCGSRGLGHQVASDYIEIMENAFGTQGLPDRELVNAPVRSRLGREYYASMCAAVNYAFANRQMIAHWVRDVFARVMGSSEGLRQVYDVCHNVAKMERHEIGGKASARSASTGRAPPGASGRDGPRSRRLTGRTASRSSFRAAWGRRPIFWPGRPKRRP